MKIPTTSALLLGALAACGDERPCVRSHEEQTVAYVLVGKVMVPIYGTRTVCDERGN